MGPVMTDAVRKELIWLRGHKYKGLPTPLSAFDGKASKDDKCRNITPHFIQTLLNFAGTHAEGRLHSPSTFPGKSPFKSVGLGHTQGCGVEVCMVHTAKLCAPMKECGSLHCSLRGAHGLC